MLEYHVPAGWACLADLFQLLEDSKAAGNIRHYALAQATLEQVGRTTRPVPSPLPGSAVAFAGCGWGDQWEACCCRLCTPGPGLQASICS